MFAGISWVMFSPSEVKSVRAMDGQILPVEKIKQGALEYVSSQIPWSQEDVDLNINYKGGDISLPSGKISLQYKIPGKTIRPGRVPLTADVLVNRKFQKRLRLNASILVYHEVIKVTRPVRRHEILKEEDLSVERVKLDRMNNGLVTRMEDAVGHKLTHHLGKGQPVTMRVIQKPALVDNGDRVLLIAERGPMKITVPGIVKEPGFKGNLVRVENTASKKIVYGRVVDENFVRVNF